MTDTATSEQQAPPTLKEGAARVKIDANIRWRVWNPFLFCNMESFDMVQETIQGHVESGIRHVASHTQVDALIGQKDKACAAITKHVNKNGSFELNTHWFFNKYMTIIVGLLLCGFVVRAPWVYDFNALTGIPVMILGIAYFVAGFQKIPTGHGAAVAFLGERMGGKKINGVKQGVNILEGYYWLPWPLFSAQIVDMREKIIQLEKDKGITVVAGITEDADNEVHNVSEEVDENISQSSGAHVIEIKLEEVIQTNHLLIEALEKAQIEQANRQGWQVDIQSLKDFFTWFTRDHPNVNQEVILSCLMEIMGKPMKYGTDRREYSVEGATEGDKQMATMMAAFDAFMGNRGGGKNRKGNGGK